MRIEEEKMIIKGREVVFRNAREDDAQILLDYLHATTRETKFLLKEPEEITLTLEQEIAFINNNNNSERDLLLLGFVDGKHVGNCSLMGNERSRYKHKVTMGIALYQEFVGMGIGRAMIAKVIGIAREKGFEQIELEVVTKNDRAVQLYKDMGFEIYGTLPNNMKYKDGTYADVYWMTRFLNK